MIDDIGYKILIPFIKTFLPQGFKNIDPDHPVVQTMEEQLKVHQQFFYAGDMIQLRMHYTSQCFMNFFGIKPEDAEPSIYFAATHPDDLQRHGVARSKYFKVGTDLFHDKKGEKFISTNMRIKHHDGIYKNLLFQGYVFYSDIPYPTAFGIMVHTDVSSILQNKYGYHYYVGNDPSYFRYPDEKLLLTGNVFSKREFDIIRCIAKGFDSSKIAEKLFLSRHTVNTHRRNILHKTAKRTTHELVIELQERGVI